MKRLFKFEASAFVLACVAAAAAVMLVHPIEERYHQNDLISVYTKIGGTVVATNVMTLSGYHRWQSQGLSTRRTLSEWGDAMFIPTNISKQYDHKF
jgi:hypothetical protein